MSTTCEVHNINYALGETCLGCEISTAAYRQGYIDGAINALTTSSRNSDTQRVSRNNDNQEAQ